MAAGTRYPCGTHVERYLGAAQQLHGDNVVCLPQVEQDDPAQVIIDATGTDTLLSVRDVRPRIGGQVALGPRSAEA
jgi:hypothetical protein